MSTSNRSTPVQGSSATGGNDGRNPPRGNALPPSTMAKEVDAEGKPVLPWAFIDCDTDDLVVLIAHMLNKLMEHNDQVVLTSSSLTRFHSRAPPAITVIDYLRRIVKYTNLERLPLLSLLAYIDITCTSLPTFTLSSLTVHRFLIAGVTAGSKALCDVFCTNAHYAKVGGIKVNELNALERELVKVTDWNLCVHAELLQQYYSSLIRSHGQYTQCPQPSDPPFTAFPLPEPQKGIFDDLEAELEQSMRLRAEQDRRQTPVDTEMDGSPPSPEGKVIRMQVDGEARQVDHPQHTGDSNQASAHQANTGRAQPVSSPISSDVEPSSRSGGSAPSSREPGEDTTASLPHASSLPTGAANVTITSATTSRTTSAYSSPRSQPSGSGSALSTSLKSTTSRGRRKSATSGGGGGGVLSFPIMTPSPASPRMDSTPAEAENMLGIVSAEDVHTYVSDTAGRPTIPHGGTAAEPGPSSREHVTSSASERPMTISQDAGRARRASSPENTYRESPSSAAIPIASSSRRLESGEPFAGSLTRSTTGEPSKSISSQQQRFKRFMGSLFRSKSVSSTDGAHSMERDEATGPSSPGGRNQSPTIAETRSPRRSHSMVPSVPPTIHAQHGSKLDAVDSYTKSPSAMSGHSSAHPGSITPRIRTRSERSVSPGRTAHRQTTTTDVEMELDEKDGESDPSDTALPLKRVRSHRERAAAVGAKTGSSTGASGTAPPIDWKCRSTGSTGLDGVVTGLH
ncbi:hypothetical protein NliqN6_4517 [Naganishia liquefaciens]|uniref:Cyclin-domain-containing protein n=1 Tax=Naganishia liquefaciens TaxID=104408 RepID=A0A8H3TVR6_9TREE|nr:hypothetical protein NliqN6_4517 [Naganishia liquefaciens]